MTAKKKDTINIAFELSFFKELLKTLSLEQMQAISEFLNQEIHSKVLDEAKDDSSNDYPQPAFTPDMIVNWEEEGNEETEIEQSEEEFIRAVQEMS